MNTKRVFQEMHEMAKTGQKIPPGYKKTEIGIIPEVWEVKKLGEVFEIISGPFGSSIKKECLSNKGIPIYSALNVIKNDFDKFYFLSSKYYSSLKRFSIKGQDLLITTRGTIGIVKKVPSKLKLGIIHSNLSILRKKSDIDILFAEYLLNSNKVKEQLDTILSQTTINALYAYNIKTFSIPLPPLDEQRAIARVLSDFDRLIESLDKLIEKKKLIKKGAMQQLLTGKKRLPGFKGEWVRKKLGDVVYFLKGQGLSKSKLSEKGKYECILYGELFTTYKEVIKKIISKTNILEGVPSQKGDILFPGSTTTTGIDLAKASALLREGVLLGGDIIILRKKLNFDSLFMAYYLNQVAKNQIAEKTSGITIHHLYGKGLVDIEISISLTLTEQRAIAQILSDMDAEIEALEKKKQKYAQMKKGAMELLLTGKIRLTHNISGVSYGE